MKKTVFILMSALMLIFVGGCASITGKEVVKEHDIKTEQDTKQFKFSKEGFKESISSNRINTDKEEDKFFRHLLLLELVEKSDLYELKEFYTTQGNIIQQGVEADIMDDFQGDGNDGNISLKHTSYGDDYVDATYSIFEVKYKESDQFYHVSAQCPSIVQEYASARGPNPERPFSIEEIKNDVISICSNMDPFLELKKSCRRRN